MNILYRLLAAAQEGVPGWHMFESVEPLDHELRDRDGQVVDVRAWLPRGANVVDRGELRKVVAFVCERGARSARSVHVHRAWSRAAGGHARRRGHGPRGCMVHAPR